MILLDFLTKVVRDEAPVPGGERWRGGERERLQAVWKVEICGAEQHIRLKSTWVFRDSPVRLAMSLSGTPSRKCIRLILANMFTVITPVLLLGIEQALEHVGQISMKTTYGSGSVLRAHQHPTSAGIRQK